MKKIGLLCLAVVLALGMLGTGFAWWSETLTIEDANLNTGEMDAGFYDQFVESNDDGSTGRIWYNAGYFDPADPGDNGDDPSEAQTLGQTCARHTGKNVASTAVTIASDYKSFEVKITNGYPSYWPTVFYTIDNNGTIPAKVKEVKITKLGGIDITPGYVLTQCVPVYVDVETGAVHASQQTGDDLMLHLSDDAGRLYKVMNPPTHEYSVCGNLDIHVLQNDENENRTMSFEVGIVVTQFNAP